MSLNPSHRSSRRECQCVRSGPFGSKSRAGCLLAPGRAVGTKEPAVRARRSIPLRHLCRMTDQTRTENFWAIIDSQKRCLIFEDSKGQAFMFPSHLPCAGDGHEDRLWKLLPTTQMPFCEQMLYPTWGHYCTVCGATCSPTAGLSWGFRLQTWSVLLYHSSLADTSLSS